MAVSGFVPRMDSTIDGVSVIGELRCRSWDGGVADVWDVACAADARGSYVSGHPRLFIPLEKSGAGDFVVAARPDLPPPRDAIAPCQISYIPADMPLWGRGSGAHRLRHLDLHFDVDALARRLGEDLDAVALATPRLMFSDDRLLALARLIATECDRPQGLHDLYGDGLAVALFIDLMQIQRRPQRQRSPLAPWQLRRVTAFIEDNCQGSIRLQELAGLVGLSPSYFSHAFKASTGMPPHQWQMAARIRRAQALLARPGATLAGIAATTGFSDQAHFTRVFKRMVGVTPAIWQRNRDL